ncbi:M48 family metallopeptidase [Pseudochelatococcus sp. G4_1912]|uniref:M48 family metallopeptidase n=1 Tax=Pseudochelatococcus sp. G4_1912 TaxID=3114288 RepID=UPI0039C63324
MPLALFRRSLKPIPEYLDVVFGSESFRVRVRPRAGVKRFTLRVSMATGEVILTMPERGEVKAAQRFIDAHGGWISQRMQRLPGLVIFEANAMIPLRGVPHRIVHWSGVRGRVTAHINADGEPIIAVTGEPPHLSRRIRDFLQAEARRDLSEAVARHTATLGVPARSITLRDTKSRWGSCSSQGRLNFSWRLILAPPMVLDYLAAHEVAHLREMNHSDRFWRLTHQLCPATPQAEAWLKRHGSSLHRYG